MLRRAAGVILCITGAWFAFRLLQWVMHHSDPGTGLPEVVLAPQFLLPFTQYFCAMIGGILALLAWRGGAWFSWPAAGLSIIIPAGLAITGAGQEIWLWPALLALVFLGCSLILTLRPRGT